LVLYFESFLIPPYGGGVGILRVKVANFNLPHLHLVPPLGMIPFEFFPDLQRQKTRVPGLSRAVACVILRLVVSV